MTNQDEIQALERELEHASKIPLASVGQPDRAECVAHRDEIAAKLRAARKAQTRPSVLDADSRT